MKPLTSVSTDWTASTSSSLASALQRRLCTALHWCRLRLFRTPLDAFITLLIGGLLLRWVPAVVGWFSWNSVAWWGDAEQCVQAQGACWPFLREKARLILFGTYPYDEQWRPALACLLLLGLVSASMIRRCYSRYLVIAWTLGSLAFFGLMRGGELGLAAVESVQWNGLPVLLMLSVFSVLGAFPLGILLALTRFQNDYPAISSIAVAYIEIIRGIPMVMVLFMGLFILPLMLPQGVSLDPLYTTLIVLIFFHAAYFAEEIRGGLQAVPKGQHEAAASQGFSYWQSMRLIVLPQALKRSMPGNMNALLGAYKDTSLVVILGIHDIMTTARMAFSEPQWQHYGVEAYCLVALWYFSTCLCLSTYSRHLEKSK